MPPIVYCCASQPAVQLLTPSHLLQRGEEALAGVELEVAAEKRLEPLRLVDAVGCTQCRQAWQKG